MDFLYRRLWLSDRRRALARTKKAGLGLRAPAELTDRTSLEQSELDFLAELKRWLDPAGRRRKLSYFLRALTVSGHHLLSWRDRRIVACVAGRGALAGQT